MSMKLLIASLVSTLAMSAMAHAGEPLPLAGPAADTEAVVAGGNQFGLALYRHLAGKEKGNLFLSPTSIHTALAMTYAGARARTAEQMAATLHFTLPQEKLHPAMGSLLKTLNTPATVSEMVPGGLLGRLVEKKAPAYQLSIANALWAHKGYPFRKEFTDLVKADYAARLSELDFARSDPARKTINDWVAQETKDKIQDLIPAGIVNSDTRLVLTNAIYFKSQWAKQFQKHATKDGDWQLAGGMKASVPLMREQAHYGYMETDDFQALQMPYKAGDLAMLVLLPRKADGLGAVEKTLSAGNLATWTKKLADAEVQVTLPRFKTTSQFSLGDALSAMGMPEAFDASKADFTGMTTADALFISAVLHKAFVAVDEEGTEAAAATAVAMALAAVHRPVEPKVFKADHPFFFAIRHLKTGAILFAGRVTDPR
jgi:serpin B